MTDASIGRPGLCRYLIRRQCRIALRHADLVAPTLCHEVSRRLTTQG
jgi:hypothetical protein